MQCTERGTCVGEFFNLDNHFFQALGKLVDCVVLSVFWSFCCIPVFTAGAATVALYYTVNKALRHGRGYVWKEFWHAFRANFGQATLVWMLCLAMTAFFSLDCYIMFLYAQAGEKVGALFILFVVFLALLSIWEIYLFPYIARFETGTKQVLKNTLLIALANLPWSLLLFVMLAIAVAAAWFVPPVTFVLPAGYMLTASFILERVFRKYMSQEDLAEEEERNREYLQ